MDVRLKQTSTKPSFLMPFTNPDFDVDVSASMVNGGAVEMGLSQVSAVDIALSFALSNPGRGSHPPLFIKCFAWSMVRHLGGGPLPDGVVVEFLHLR